MGQIDGQIAITFNAPLTAGGISSHSSTGGQRLHHFCRLVNTTENAVFKSRLKTFIPLLSGFLFFLCSLTRCLAPAPVKLRPHGAIQICLLLLLSTATMGSRGMPEYYCQKSAPCCGGIRALN